MRRKLFLLSKVGGVESPGIVRDSHHELAIFGGDCDPSRVDGSQLRQLEALDKEGFGGFLQSKEGISGDPAAFGTEILGFTDLDDHLLDDASKGSLRNQQPLAGLFKPDLSEGRHPCRSSFLLGLALLVVGNDRVAGPVGGGGNGSFLLLKAEGS